MQDARRVIEFERHLFLAEEEDRDGGALISTYVSPLVDRLDPLWYSIRKTLAQSCYTVSESRTIKDPDMMFGCAESIEFDVFDSCPGNTDHQCVEERSLPLIAQRERSHVRTVNTVP